MPCRERPQPLDAELINGVFGDPLLLLSVQQSRRYLLFDLGDTRNLPLRCAHRVTDVFVSHAHLDHIGGFIGLLRARLGTDNSLCRFYGPPGLSGHIAGMLRGMLWDRIGDRGPIFDIHEWHGGRLLRYRLQAGIESPQRLADRPIENGILLVDEDFRIRATELDHGTPVLAYAFEPAPGWQMDKKALERSGLPPGPWLGQLVEANRGGKPDRQLQLPDGRRLEAGPLAERLLVARPVAGLVYATDLADTPDNRRRLIELAGGADTLFCEATFAQADERRARAHSHLTTRACGEIAAAAGVRQLVPFHFSKRYEGREEMLYDEIGRALNDTVIELVKM
ncbi:MBL fold metallo-hydrolase [Marinobacterium aestuariivivens]|uniref:MBL fold metallo-hydrolase n=1 Tax=Marinobacterium aestuariivivens TaxID=1698799 RepID=A0ABW1ZYU5_9GAMM